MSGGSPVAIIFPGQGAQSVGMGRELARHHSIVKETFQEADEVLGFALSDICWQGPSSRLRDTTMTQPAILTMSVAGWRLLQQTSHIKPGAAAGFSLGEYSALVASGTLSFASALQIVRIRAKAMNEACAPGTGGMVAVIGLSRDQVEALCRAVQDELNQVIVPANYNCPGQITVSGQNEAVKRFQQRAREAGARRVVELDVSGPFHTSLLEDAVRRLEEAFEDHSWHDPEFPVYSNVDAEPVERVEAIKQRLLTQVISPVKWQQVMERLLAKGFETFVEIGPGQSLKGFLRRIDRSASCYPLAAPDDLPQLLESLEGVC